MTMRANDTDVGTEAEKASIRNVLEGFASRRDATGLLLFAAGVDFRPLAEEELRRRTWNRLLSLLSDEQLAMIHSGQIDFAALCREAADKS